MRVTKGSGNPVHCNNNTITTDHRCGGVNIKKM